jgi:Xaa-Pro aminopeptidase
MANDDRLQQVGEHAHVGKDVRVVVHGDGVCDVAVLSSDDLAVLTPVVLVRRVGGHAKRVEEGCVADSDVVVVLACQVMLETTRPGVSEIEIYAAIMHEFHRHGAGMAHDLFVHSGPDNLSWDAPRWLYRSQPARIVQEGDMVLAEMMPAVGGLEAQAQMCVAVGDVAPEFHRAAQVARESYERGFDALRPGAKFGEVADAMAEPLRRAGAWHITPLIHSLTPLTMVGRVTQGTYHSITDRFKQVTELAGTDLDVVIEPGMTFQLEPDAVFGRRQVNIGGNVIVTDDGHEELNSVPTRLRFASY